MARRNRIHIPGHFYHITQRGNAKQRIFFDDYDKHKFLSLMQEGIKRFGHKIHAFCLMGNHVHLLIQAGRDPLGKAMQNLTFRYSRYLNKKQQKTGHQFQGRYYGGLIDEERYLLEVLKYIHLNPLRANLVTRLDDYPWSSHGHYAGHESIPWIEQNFCLSLIGNSPIEARKNYFYFIDQQQPEDVEQTIQGQCSEYFIGTDDFMEKIQQNASEKIIARCGCVESIIKVVCDHFNVSPKIIRPEHVNNESSRLRGIIGYIVMNYTDQSLSTYARHIGKSLSSVSRSTKKISEQINEHNNCEMNLRIQSILNHIQTKH